MIADLLQIPLPDRSIYNELAPDGVTPRPHWAHFIESLMLPSARAFVGSIRGSGVNGNDVGGAVTVPGRNATMFAVSVSVDEAFGLWALSKTRR